MLVMFRMSLLPPLSALSPSSFLFPSSDSGFVSLYSSAASLSSRTSVAFVSSASSSFTPLSSSVSASSLPLPPLSYPPRPSFLSPAAGVSAPPPLPGFPPLPPGFPPLSSSSSLVSSSLSLSAFSLASSSLPSVVYSVSSTPVSALPSSTPFGSSSSPSSSSSLDYASYKAHVLGISDEYVSLTRWYNSVDGSNFFSFLSSHCPHLSADVAKDFSSGSTVLLSTLQSSAALPSGPPASALGTLPSSLFSSAVPALTPSSVLLKGFAAAPVSSAAFLSSLPSGLASLVGPPPLLAQSLSSSSLPPSSLSRAGGPLGFGAVADPSPSAVPQYAPPVSSLFRPFDAPSTGPSGVFSSSSTSLPLHGSSPAFTSAPPSGVPPPPVAPLGSSFSSAARGPSFAPPQPGPEVPARTSARRRCRSSCSLSRPEKRVCFDSSALRGGKQGLFRQNTYLQNKKHTLTCQGGTGCYRFNYQPGS